MLHLSHKNDILNQCWVSAVDDWPTLDQHCCNVSRLLGGRVCSSPELPSNEAN